MNRALLLFLLLFFEPLIVSAQPAGSWSSAVVCANCEPFALMTWDSDTLIAITGTPPEYYSWRSTDVGKHWQRSEEVLVPVASKVGYDFFDVLPNGNIYFKTRAGGGFLTRDKGLSWEFTGGLPKSVATEFISEDTALAILRNGSMIEVRRSVNGGATFDDRVFEHDYGEDFTGSVAQDFQILSAERVSLLLRDNSRASVLTTTNAGNSWSNVYLDESVSSKLFTAQYFVPTKDPLRIYAVAGFEDSVDFYASTDGGMTWKPSSRRAPQRVYRLIETKPNELWMLVGKFPDIFNVSDLYGTFLTDEKFADTLLYSNDGGQSWTAAGNFANQVVIELLTGRNGRVHVLSRNEGSVVVSTFEPNSEDVQTPSDNPSVAFYPNPVDETLNVIFPEHALASVTFCDPLGRVLFRTRHNVSAGQVEQISLNEALNSYHGPLYICLEYNGYRSSKLMIKK